MPGKIKSKQPRLLQRAEFEWEIPPSGRMRVPAIIYASAVLINDMDDKVFEQAANVASLPGIINAAYAMPDAHWGYGFPIGGVAAFDPERGGVVSAGGVGFDISCGVRTLHTGLQREVIGLVTQEDRLQRGDQDAVGRQGCEPDDDEPEERALEP